MLDYSFMDRSAFIVMNMKELNLRERQVVALMAIFAFQKAGNRFPSSQEISDKTGITTPEVETVIGELIEKRFLTIETIKGELAYCSKAIYDHAIGKFEETITNTGKLKINLVSLFEDKLGRNLDCGEKTIIKGWEEDGVEISLMTKILDQVEIIEDNIPYAQIEKIIKG